MTARRQRQEPRADEHREREVQVEQRVVEALERQHERRRHKHRDLAPRRKVTRQHVVGDQHEQQRRESEVARDVMVRIREDE